MQNRRPAGHLALLELPRAAMEMATLPLALPLLAGTPRGDGHGVLVIPGFMGEDQHTAVMRQFLTSKGYQTFGWSLGRNLGMARAGGINALLTRLQDIFEVTGRKKVSIVGWSLGGVFARRMAKIVPDQVRQVVSMGTPIGNPVDSNAYDAYQQVNHRPQSAIDHYINENVRPAPVPSTAIYSRTDGVVPPHIAQEPHSATTENIEVVSSHTGLVVNPQVFHLVGRKLAFPENGWKKITNQ